MFGRFLAASPPPANPLSQPAKDSPAAMELPVESLRNSRRFKSFILTSLLFKIYGIDINTSFIFTIDIRAKNRDIKRESDEISVEHWRLRTSMSIGG